MRMRHTVICSLLGSTVFFHIISLTVRFKKKNVIEHKVCVLIVSKTVFQEHVRDTDINVIWYFFTFLLA